MLTMHTSTEWLDAAPSGMLTVSCKRSGARHKRQINRHFNLEIDQLLKTIQDTCNDFITQNLDSILIRLEKNNIAPYRMMCCMFRTQYLRLLTDHLNAIDEKHHPSVINTVSVMTIKRWRVHHTSPTAHTKIIEEYLGRYICRVGISKSKIAYDRNQNKISIIYNDYKHQLKNQPAPKAVKDIEPLVAIQSIIQHVLPTRLQKVRYFGIMTTSQQKKIAKVLSNLIKENKVTRRTLFQIIKALLKIPEDQDLICEKCQGIEFSVSEIPTNSKLYQQHIRKNSLQNQR